MAGERCKRCSSELASGTAKCMKCGATPGLSKSTKITLFVAGGCALAILVPLAIIVAIALLSTAGGDAVKSEATGSAGALLRQTGTHKSGETFQIGYTTYCVSKSWWSTKLSNNPFLNLRPDASFLMVELTVRNDDTKARMVPPFQMIDELGSEYDEFSGASMIEGSIGVFTDLNPGVTKRGIVVFDTPAAHTYKLKVSGGYWSGEEALIELEPSPQR